MSYREMPMFGWVSRMIKPVAIEPVKTKKVNLAVTLWPSFAHFPRFAKDDRVQSIRLNSAMMQVDELEHEFKIASQFDKEKLWFDIKGRQLRIVDVIATPHHLEIVLNHSIYVEMPTVVLFKAGADHALAVQLEDDGKRLIFDGGPEFMVKKGESVCIRASELIVRGDLFTDYEKKKIDMAMKYGFRKYFLSYVESLCDVLEFKRLVGDSEIIAKIENPKGLQYVESFNYGTKLPWLSLMAARGDLFVEMDKPHEILNALKNIIKADPMAHVGSRILLSTFKQDVPEMADFSDLAWLYDIGYRNMMLCDELCLFEKSLAVAVSAFDQFRKEYCIK